MIYISLKHLLFHLKRLRLFFPNNWGSLIDFSQFLWFLSFVYICQFQTENSGIRAFLAISDIIYGLESKLTTSQGCVRGDS